jgi:hypothetical protein
MFAGGYESRSSQGDNFKTTASMYRLVRKLSDLRNDYAPLRRGEQWVRWSNAESPGIYAFSRIYEGQEVVVVLNTSNQSQNASNLWVDAHITPGGTTLVDALHPRYQQTVRASGGGSQIDVTIPAKGVRVLVHRDQYRPQPSLRRFDATGRDITPKTALPAMRGFEEAGSTLRGRVDRTAGGSGNLSRSLAHDSRARVYHANPEWKLREPRADAFRFVGGASKAAR